MEENEKLQQDLENKSYEKDSIIIHKTKEIKCNIKLKLSA